MQRNPPQNFNPLKNNISQKMIISFTQIFIVESEI